jgi:hypothetical protein
VIDAQDSFRKVFEIRQRLNPSDDQAQQGLPFAHQKLGDSQLRCGQVTAAVASYQMGLLIRQKLVAADPSDSEVQSGMPFAYNKLGDLQIRTGK